MSGIATTKEIIEIISACSSNSVKKIVIGNVSIEFDSNNPPYQTKNTLSMDAKGSDLGESIVSNHNPNSLDNEGFEEAPFIDLSDEEFEGLDELEYLAIEDPARFEELTLKVLVENQGRVVEQ